MTDKSEALRLADCLETHHRLASPNEEAAAELRRQHDEIKRLHEVNQRLHESNTANFQSNKELALIVRVLCATYRHPLPEESLARSNTAIAKATGVTKE